MSTRVPAGLLLAFILAACSGGGEAAAPVATNHVDLPRSYRFAPEAIAVEAGTTVTWTNNDQFTHSVRLLDDRGAVLTMAPGETVSYTFEAAGLHRYDCSLHPHDMKGSVEVEPHGS